ncbi:hypothetical protein GOHSU_61_00080 [Gordonia hirsuta DSM 44140 = NBRC 16056]|uniref:DUF8020 domain-containing protein n=1 Tax=Gordonia hirsuta DSM 44140 = NBRC 16056 TaxID=1121927 RepID=L7LDW7_9ACTN|nr:hypothetical protein [Gordonia hirsuta]GAC58941.1 hypothetical protein GOHSU_61_00080 [Gordonia hirsuta DSM 44140 = NBRC 16056]
MRQIRRLFIALIAVTTALPLMAGVNSASAAPTSSSIDATVERNQNDLVVKVASGSMAVEDGYLVFRNNAGKTLDKYNLTFVAPNKAEYDVAAVVQGRTATLTPSKVARTQVRKRKPNEIVCGPQTRAQRDQEALTKLATELGVSSAIGGLIGAGVGAILALFSVGMSIPIGTLIGVAIGFGGAAANGTFTRYFDTINKPFKRQYC